MTQERLNSLIEQTSFLLEKQKELLNKTSSVFTDVLSVVEKKLKNIDQDSRKQDTEDLKTIQQYVSDFKQKSDEQIKDDIDFLAEQLSAMTQIKYVNDDAKQEELLNMIIDKDEKIPDTQAFKKKVSNDLGISFRDLDLMFDDLKSALEEDDIHEIKLLFEAIKDQEKEQEKKDQGCCSSDNDVDFESCSGCSQSCCNSVIFADLSSKGEKDDKEDHEEDVCGGECSNCKK